MSSGSPGYVVSPVVLTNRPATSPRSYALANSSLVSPAPGKSCAGAGGPVTTASAPENAELCTDSVTSTGPLLLCTSNENTASLEASSVPQPTYAPGTSQPMPLV